MSRPKAIRSHRAPSPGSGKKRPPPTKHSIRPGRLGKTADAKSPLRHLVDGIPVHRMSMYLALITESRLLQGTEAAVALWRDLGIPGLRDPSPATARPTSPPKAAPSNQSLEMFLSECVTRHTTNFESRVSAKDLFAKYSDFCSSRHLERRNARALSKALRDVGFTRIKASHIFYIGIELLPSAFTSATVLASKTGKEVKPGG